VSLLATISTIERHTWKCIAHGRQKPETLETLRLAIELLRRIPRNRKVSTTELHQELNAAGFERDERSIQRLLKTLSEHFDIERDDKSLPYGYRWNSQGQGLMVPTLNRQESLLLLLAEQHLQPLLPPSVLKSMDGFFRQARANLAPHQNAVLENNGWAKCVWSVKPSRCCRPRWPMVCSKL